MKCKHNVNMSIFEKIEDPRVAYFLGFLWADGCIHTKKYSHLVRIAIISEDFNYIKNILNFIGNWGIYIYKPKPKNWKEKTCASLHDKFLCDFLIENDYQSKSWNSADKILDKIPENLRCYWWRGLFDGDGSIYAKSGHTVSCNIHSGIEQDWKFAENLAKNLKANYYIYRRERKKGNESVFRFSSRESTLNFLKYIYNNYESDKIGYERKYNKYIEALNIINSQKIINQNKYTFVVYSNQRKKWFIKHKKTGFYKYGFSSDDEAFKYAQNNNLTFVRLKHNN